MSVFKNIGVTLLLCYIGQVVIGMIIHKFKTPRLFNGRRPPQNYFHAVLGLFILGLAGYQVRPFVFLRCLSAC